MKYSLKAKLTLTYMLVALISVALISVLANVFLDKHFRTYIIENQERNNNEIVALISQQYTDDGQWKVDFIENIGIYALEKGLIIKVLNKEGKIIWDATEHNNGMCQRMILNMSQNMMSRYPNWQGSYEETEYKIYHKLTNVGTLKIGYYGPFYFSNSDLTFINTINKLLVWVGGISLLLSLFLGAYISRRISKPISRVISSAKMISQGYFGDRIPETANTKETHQLTTAINDLAQTLENQEELRRRLTADVAHELRTPLATLQSHMEAMIDGIWNPDKERLESCHSEVMRINRMVGDLEKLARFESENLILNKSKFNLNDVLKNILKNFESEFANKKIDFKFDSIDVEIYADRDKIYQVFINIISNAIKYTKNGGKVFVEVENNFNNVKIVIKDTGIGIGEEDLPYIFERFYRADKSRNRLTGGAGIGLTISNTIIIAHKGKIEVKSKINKGTEFEIVLPK